MVSIQVDIDARNILAAFKKSPEVVEMYLERAFVESSRLVQREARQSHRFTSRTGQLERSVQYEVSLRDLQAVIKLKREIAPYAPFVHEPTGIFSGRGYYPIVAKRKKSLRWALPGGGGFVFAKRVMHPGSPADRFLYEAAERKAEEIHTIFSGYTQEALKEVGLDA